MPRVTVAIPTRNRSKWLGGAIASVLAQDFEDLRLVVSDNASTDATPEVVRGFDDPRLEYDRLPSDVGLLENHNRIFRSTRSDYLLILPDDDRIAPGLLSRTVAALDEHPRAGMVHTGFDTLNQRGDVVVRAGNWSCGLTRDTVESGADFIRESMFYSCRVCASSALMRTAALPPTFFELEDFPAIDFGMWLRMAVDWDIAFIADSLAAYRIHDASHSSAPGVGEPTHDGYIHGFAHLDKLLELKLRFIERYADRLDDTAVLRELAYRGRHRELLNVARGRTLPERQLRATARAFAAVTRHEPRMLTNVGMLRLLAASVIGPRAVDRIKAARQAKST